jgi:hypothetical protein
MYIQSSILATSVLVRFHCCNKYLRKTILKKKFFTFDPWLQRVQSMVPCPCAWQNIMAVKVGGRVTCSPFGQWEAERRGLGTRYNLQNHTPTDLLSPKFPQPHKTVPPVSTSVPHVSLWNSLHIQTVTTSMDSTNCRWKILEKSISERSKKQNFSSSGITLSPSA